MMNYIIKRLLGMTPMMLCITLVSFLIMNFAPGEPAEMYIKPNSGVMTQAEIDNINKLLGLDKPVVIRYFMWLKELLKGNLGYSYMTGQSVIKEITSRIGITLMISSLSVFIAFAVGVSVGVFSALHQYRLSDYIISLFTFLGISIPSFWLAMMLILFFGIKLNWLPIIGLNDINLVNPTFFQRLIDRVKHLILPVFVLAFSHMAGWTRYQRSAFLEVINQDYIRTARSKGLTENTITWRHAIRNSALPIVTLLGMSLSSLIGGAFLIENIFGIPGMGRLGTTAIMQRDYPLIMGVTLFSSVLVLIGNLLADILYIIVDPRIRYS